MTLYELTGADDLRFSPYCWRARMALKHKGLAFDIEACRFTDKEKIAFSGQEKVPVLRDGDKTVSDSWTIACYLENAYPEAPSLFGGEAARELAHFINIWTDTRLNPTLLRLIIKEVFDRTHASDRDYFRRTREAKLGDTLEALHAGRDGRLATLHQILAPLDTRLAETPFLCGRKPAYADYIVFGTLQWARLTSRLAVLDEHRALNGWFERMLDLFDGIGRAHSAATQA